MALKVYGGRYDGKTRVIVAAESFKKAFEAVSAVKAVSSFGVYRAYTAITGNARETQVALADPGIVFASPNDYHSPFTALSPKP